MDESDSRGASNVGCVPVHSNERSPSICQQEDTNQRNV